MLKTWHRYRAAILLLAAAMCLSLPGNLRSQQASDGEVVLRVTAPQVTSMSDNLIVAMNASAQRVVGIDDGSSPGGGDRNGRARPGARGNIIIKGTGLSGASEIKFEGEGVSGRIVPSLP